MIEPEPLHFALAQHVVNDITNRLTDWRAAVDQRRLAVMSEYREWLGSMSVPDGTTFEDYTEAHADMALERWCQQRDELAKAIVTAFIPSSIVTVQQLGLSPDLGHLIGLYLDDALRDLDRDLRSCIPPMLDRTG